jgi:type IV pilus assembly protein PilA
MKNQVPVPPIKFPKDFKLHKVGKWDIFLLFLVLFVIIAIAIPNFLRFNAKAKQSESKQNLMAIYEAYQSYHTFHQTYPSLPSIQIGNTIFNCISVAGWTPSNSFSYIRYNYNCMNVEAFSPAVNDSPCPPGTFTTATKDSFTVASCGNVDSDTFVDVWTIDDGKHLRNVRDDVWNKVK